MPMSNTGKALRLVLVFLFFLILFCLSAAGIAETYKCGEAAEMLRTNADAYRDPVPTVEEILGGLSPYAPLTRMDGCEMLLRAFGPLPDVQVGVRYLVKYRDCAFTDVPEQGKEAVENLTNAGLYVPEDNTVFGPDELMTEHELYLLVDRIHAYLQSSPKDDYYSWATAELLNDPDFFNVPYELFLFAANTTDKESHLEWIIDMLNDCLNNPDTPEKANIAAYLSTYMDQDGRENSMKFIQPMVDAIWNAADFNELTEICADISRETDIELLLTKNDWCDWDNLGYRTEPDGHIVRDIGYEFFSGDLTPEDFLPGSYIYEAFLEQTLRLMSYLGFEKAEMEPAIRNYLEDFRHTGQIMYDASPLSEKPEWIVPVDDDEAFACFPLKTYLEHAGLEWHEKIYLDNYAEVAIALTLMSEPENLPGVKVYLIRELIRVLNHIVPPHIRDALHGYWDPYYAADPSLYYSDKELSQVVLSLVQPDTYIYYSKTEEYHVMLEFLDELCRNIIVYYRDMMENTTWLSEETRSTVIEKLDAMKWELLIPKDMSGLLHVQYVSAQDGGTLYENTIRYLKARRQWLSEHFTGNDLDYTWSIRSNWSLTYYYKRNMNTFFINLNAIIGSHAGQNSSYEELLGYLGFTIAHEISHAFDYNGSKYNKDGKIEDLWTKEERDLFDARCKHLGEFMCGYEAIPGECYTYGNQIVDESVADLTALKCIMGIASGIPDFDYRTFFACLADFIAVSVTRNGYDRYMKNNEHTAGRCRINRLLSLTDEFYTTFDVHEGDAMYVAPENRPEVW